MQLSPPQTPTELAESWAVRASKTSFAVFVSLSVVRLALLASSVEPPPLQRSMELLWLMSGLITTLSHVARWLPLQNVVVIALIVAGATCGMQWIWFGTVSFCLSVIGIISVLNARGSAEFLLREWRGHRHYGFWLIGVASLLVAAAGAVLQRRVGIETSGEFVATALTLLLCAPWFIDKRGAQHTGDWYPLATWTLANVIFLMTSAA